MIRKRLWLIGAFLWAIPAFGATPTPFPVTTPTGTPEAVPTKILNLKAKTVWANLRIRLETKPDTYKIRITSDVPMAEWYLLPPKGSAVIAKGSGGMRFKCEKLIRAKFVEGTRLKVVVQAEEDPKPITVFLGGKSGSDDPEPLDPNEEVVFPSNPSRPYNGLVKDLYLTAWDGYQKGHYADALASLDQARKLDPTHPMVLELRSKIRKKLKSSTQGPDLRDIKHLWKSGDYAIALEKLDLILRDDPECAQALAMKKDIEAENTGKKPAVPRRRKHREPADIADAATPTPGISSEDKATLADTSYNLGLEAYRKGNFSEAKKFWEETLRYQVHHAQARNALNRLEREHSELYEGPKTQEVKPKH